jgi:hypothetical protein
MERLLYQPHEARRHTADLREILHRTCKSVFPGPKIDFCLKDGPWYARGPAEQVSILLFQKTGCCRRHPVCKIEIDRPKTGAGSYNYTKSTALFLDPAQQAGNTRLVGHLQRHCPFLHKFEVDLAYETSS